MAGSYRFAVRSRALKEVTHRRCDLLVALLARLGFVNVYIRVLAVRRRHLRPSEIAQIRLMTSPQVGYAQEIGETEWLMPPSEERANLRSETPPGFAKAEFLANGRGAGQTKQVPTTSGI